MAKKPSTRAKSAHGVGAKRVKLAPAIRPSKSFKSTRIAENQKPIEQYDHKDKKRTNNPPVGLVTKDTEPSPEVSPKKVYRFDEHLDPALTFDPQAVRDRLSATIEEGLAPVNPAPNAQSDDRRATHTLAESTLADQLAIAKTELDRTKAALGRARQALETLRDAQAPYLNWTGKAERMSFDVPTVSLHVHERIDPRTVIEAVRRPRKEEDQPSLFEQPGENPPLREAIDFYKHEHNWTNRMVAGDSLLVMNSLLEKEGMAGKVQMVYLDPPYGIKYGSNFQPFVNKRNVKDANDEDLTQEPEMLKAFRDTWEFGNHSYLTYLRDRLWLAKDLLHETGSCFVQISDENLHHVRELLDEVFGAKCFKSIIAFAKAGGGLRAADRLASRVDYILWYARDSEAIKYRQLYEKRADPIGAGFSWVETPDGVRRRLTTEERTGRMSLPKGGVLFGDEDLTKPGPGAKYEIEFEGRVFESGKRWWGMPKESLKQLLKTGRVIVLGNKLRFVRYESDAYGRALDNVWDGLGGQGDPIYVVQTNVEVVKRCLLMTTDPGDLVLDPTCGSGTTAFVAEFWGRRWITCDTSRVAVALAKQRLMTQVFPYFRLAHSVEGIGSGFVYSTARRVSPSAIANNPEIRAGMSREAIEVAIQKYAEQDTLYDHPEPDTSKARVTGPFTVEAVPAPVVRPVGDVEDGSGGLVADGSIARSGVTVRARDWRDELLKTGVRGRSGQRINFSRVEPLAGTRWLHADAETKEDQSKRVVVSFGPEHAPLEQKQVELAWEEARTLNPKPAMILFAAFQFDPEAAKDIDELTPEKTGIIFLKIQMNTDLLTEDLKKKRSSNESFWLIGQPDIDSRKITKGQDAGKWVVEVRGFDYYNPKTGSIESGDTSKIALWMLDTDYNGRSLYPRQVFFPMAGDKDGWAKLANNLKAEIDPVLIEAYRGTVSLPFELGEYNRIAVKIVDDRGIESLKVMEVQ